MECAEEQSSSSSFSFVSDVRKEEHNDDGKESKRARKATHVEILVEALDAMKDVRRVLSQGRETRSNELLRPKMVFGEHQVDFPIDEGEMQRFISTNAFVKPIEANVWRVENVEFANSTVNDHLNDIA